MDNISGETIRISRHIQFLVRETEVVLRGSCCVGPCVGREGGGVFS